MRKKGLQRMVVTGLGLLVLVWAAACGGAGGGGGGSDGASSGSSGASIVGEWVCMTRTAQGDSPSWSLSFDASGTAVVNGNPTSYEMPSSDQLVFTDASTGAPRPYEITILSNDVLEFATADRSTVHFCERSAGSGSGTASGGGSGGSDAGWSGGSSGNGGGSIVGTWLCNVYDAQGNLAQQGTLTFQENGVMQGGQAYQLTDDGRLILSGQDGRSDTYQIEALTSTALSFRYTDGSRFVCQRTQGGATAGSGSGSPGAGGDTAGLYGWFCTFSGSSIGGTYGKLTGIYFDGQGNWSMSGETYSSGSAGTYYGSGAEDSGTYSLQGNTIYYTTSSGEQGTAQVYVRQPTGEITEIMIDGAVYSKSTCDL